MNAIRSLHPYQILKDSIVVFLAYIPLGMGFGLLASEQLGFSVFEIFICSLVIYSGSMQYALVGLLAGGASVWMVLLTTILVNFRHFFYTLTLLKSLRACKNPLKHYLIFALTDETFALICANRYTDGQKILLSFLNHSYWMAGGVLGAVFSHSFKLSINGLDFTLIAFFTVLALELIRTSALATLVSSVVLAVLAFFLLPQNYMLIFCLVGGAICLMVFYKRGLR